MIAVQCFGCGDLINFASVCTAYAISGHVPIAAYINDLITFTYVPDARLSIVQSCSSPSNSRFTPGSIGVATKFASCSPTHSRILSM